MASGMSWSTAKNYSCAAFRLDPVGLRTHEECAFVTGPAYGRLLLEHDEAGQIAVLRLQVLSGLRPEHVLLETAVDASSCGIIP